MSTEPDDLIERLRAELDRLEAISQPAALHIAEHGWHDGGGMCSEEWDFIDSNGPDVVLRTIQAHRKILDRHGPGVSHPEECGRCNDPWPCDDVRALASIYFPEGTG